MRACEEEKKYKGLARKRKPNIVKHLDAGIKDDPKWELAFW